MIRGGSRLKPWTRRARLRASSGRVVTWAMVPVLAIAVSAGGREPVRALLADASGSGSHTAASSNDSMQFRSVATVSSGRIRLPAAATVRRLASISSSPVAMTRVGVAKVPTVALVAYQRAAQVIDAADAQCHLSWTLLAAIGQVESDHGQVGGSHLDPQGVASPPILGPVLDGRHGVGLIRDTDAGRLDGNRRFDRAVGPMQFLPSTWATWRITGFGDTGEPDIMNPFDAVPTAARLLCADGAATGTAGLHQAIFDYNHATWYVDEVLALAAEYAREY